MWGRSSHLHPSSQLWIWNQERPRLQQDHLSADRILGRIHQERLLLEQIHQRLNRKNEKYSRTCGNWSHSALRRIENQKTKTKDVLYVSLLLYNGALLAILLHIDVYDIDWETCKSYLQHLVSNFIWTTTKTKSREREVVIQVEKTTSPMKTRPRPEPEPKLKATSCNDCPGSLWQVLHKNTNDFLESRVHILSFCTFHSQIKRSFIPFPTNMPKLRFDANTFQFLYLLHKFFP